MLDQLTDRHGGRATSWAADPLRESTRVLELGLDAGALRAELGPRWVGAGPAVAHAPGLRAELTDLPLRTNAVDGLCLLSVVPGTAALDDLFAEVRRVLRPAGTLVVVGPSARPRWSSRLRTVHRSGWRNRSGLDDVSWLLTAADFAVIAEQLVPFAVEVPSDPADVDALATRLSAVGLWPPDPSAAARDQLHAAAGTRWPVPLRRLVARR